MVDPVERQCRKAEDLQSVVFQEDEILVLFSTMTYIRSTSERKMNYAFDSVQLLVSLRLKNSLFPS